MSPGTCQWWEGWTAGADGGEHGAPRCHATAEGDRTPPTRSPAHTSCFGSLPGGTIFSILRISDTSRDTCAAGVVDRSRRRAGHVEEGGVLFGSRHTHDARCAHGAVARCGPTRTCIWSVSIFVYDSSSRHSRSWFSRLGRGAEDARRAVKWEAGGVAPQNWWGCPCGDWSGFVGWPRAAARTGGPRSRR